MAIVQVASGVEARPDSPAEMKLRREWFMRLTITSIFSEFFTKCQLFHKAIYVDSMCSHILME